VVPNEERFPDGWQVSEFRSTIRPAWVSERWTVGRVSPGTRAVPHAGL